MNIRVKLIQFLIHLNENILFYPKLRRFYFNQKLDNNAVIFDVGVNKGQSIDFFLKLYPNATFYGFEPNKKLFDFITKKYKDNKNIHLFNFGASSSNGTLVFKENIMDETSSFENLNMDSTYLSKKAKILGVSKDKIFSSEYNVDVIKLSEFIHNNSIKEIDVLKVDVEGHELSVFEGLFDKEIHTKIKWIQFENHQDDMYLNSKNQFDKINKVLLKNRFEPFIRIKHGFGDISEELYKYNE